MSPDSTVLTILAGISGVLTLIPLPWHLESWNIGTVFYMFWVSLGCFNIFIGGIVWRNDAIIRAIPWCYFCAFWSSPQWKAQLMPNSRPDPDYSVLGHSFLFSLYQQAPVFDCCHSFCIKKSRGKATRSVD